MTQKSDNPMEELLASLSNSSLSLQRGQEVEGEIVAISDKEVIVDLGLKSEGMISLRDLQSGQNLKVGDRIKAYVIEAENEFGQIILSQIFKRTTRQSPIPQILSDEIWNERIREYQKNEIVKGIVTKITQNGVFVQLEEGIEGLIHSSKFGPDTTFVVGSEVSVIIDAIDPTRRRISLVPVLTSTKGLIYK